MPPDGREVEKWEVSGCLSPETMALLKFCLFGWRLPGERGQGYDKTAFKSPHIKVGENLLPGMQKS